MAVQYYAFSELSVSNGAMMVACLRIPAKCVWNYVYRSLSENL